LYDWSNKRDPKRIADIRAQTDVGAKRMKWSWTGRQVDKWTVMMIDDDDDN